MGLKGEMGESRNNTQQIQDKQPKQERKMEEEEKNKLSEGDKMDIDSVRQQRGNKLGAGMSYGEPE